MFFMKISNNPNIQKILGVYKNNTAAVQKPAKVAQEKDKVEISDRAKDFQWALNAYKNLPDVRKEKVEEVTRKIQSGTYNPTGEEIADSMFNKKI